MDIFKKNDYQFDMLYMMPLKALINLKQLVFEVTSHCNLNCYYCGYGELYNMRPNENERKNLDFLKAKNLIDYLFDLWNKHELDYDQIDTFIGFYGGEPLLNF